MDGRRDFKQVERFEDLPPRIQEIVRAVFEHGSATAAAGELHITVGRAYAAMHHARVALGIASSRPYQAPVRWMRERLQDHIRAADARAAAPKVLAELAPSTRELFIAGCLVEDEMRKTGAVTELSHLRLQTALKRAQIALHDFRASQGNERRGVA